MKVVEMHVIWYNNNNIVAKGVLMRKQVREIEFDVDAYTADWARECVEIGGSSA